MRQESNSIEAYGLIEAVHDTDTDTDIVTSRFNFSSGMSLGTVFRVISKARLAAVVLTYALNLLTSR